MEFYSKLKWVLGIILIFGLIVTTNLIDRNSFLNVRESLETIYEDRLIAYDLIVELDNALHKKEVALLTQDMGFFESDNAKLNVEIDRYLSSYEQTYLTSKEQDIYDRFLKNLRNHLVLENTYLNGNKDNLENLKGSFVKLSENLYELSKVQLNEGSRQILKGKKAISTVDLFTKVEIIVLVILAITIQIIVMYKPKEMKLED